MTAADLPVYAATVAATGIDPDRRPEPPAPIRLYPRPVDWAATTLIIPRVPEEASSR